MNWSINFSKDSLESLECYHCKEDFIIDKIKLSLRKFKGENTNINIKRLKGNWEGFYRIRSGKLRIIAEFQFEHCRVYIDRVDWRGNVYK